VLATAHTSILSVKKSGQVVLTWACLMNTIGYP